MSDGPFDQDIIDRFRNCERPYIGVTYVRIAQSIRDAERDRLRAAITDALVTLRTLTDHYREEGAHDVADQTALVYRTLAGAMQGGDVSDDPTAIAQAAYWQERADRLSDELRDAEAERDRLRNVVARLWDTLTATHRYAAEPVGHTDLNGVAWLTDPTRLPPEIRELADDVHAQALAQLDADAEEGT